MHVIFQRKYFTTKKLNEGNGIHCAIAPLY